MAAHLNCYQILLAVGMLLTGSINTLSKKAQNNCNSTGLADENGDINHKFDHPWFQTLIMFIGESLCLLGLLHMRRKERQIWRHQLLDVVHSGSNGGSVPDQLSQPRVFQWIIAIPTICDLFGTTLSGIGLLYVDASVWQMLRGSIIIFAGILSKVFLKRILYPIHWLGMIVTMLGLVLVGLSSVLKAHHTTSQAERLLGVFLILGSQTISAAQMIIEEVFLKKRNLPPLQVVGMEGTFGIIFMAFIVLPALYFVPGSQNHHSYENSIDAMLMIKNNYKLLIFCLLYLLSIAFYNYFGLAVTRSLTAVHRTLIDACRTMLVWVVGLFIYYVIDETYGEPFDKQYGVFQIDGFLFLLIGTAMYNQLIVIPRMMPPPNADLARRDREIVVADSSESSDDEVNVFGDAVERNALLSSGMSGSYDATAALNFNKAAVRS